MLLLEYIHWLERNQAAEKTIKNYSNKVRIFVEWLEPQNIGVPEVHPDLVFTFHNHLMIDRKQKPATRTTYLRALRSYGDFLITQAIFKENPFRAVAMPKIHKVPPDQLDEEEIAKIMNAAFEKKNEKGMRDLAIIAVLAGTACRVSALIGMKITDFRPTVETVPENCQHCGQYITSGRLAGRGKKVKMTMVRIREKGGKEWDVIVPEKAAFYLQQYLSARKIGVNSDIVFPTVRNKEVRAISRHGVLTMVKVLSRKAGLTRKISPHSFRHAAITWWLDIGIDPEVVQRWVGHRALSQTMEYRNKSIRSFVWSGIAMDRNLLNHVHTPMDIIFKKMNG